MFKQLSLAAALGLFAGTANATTVGFDLVISGSNNVPTFTITNQSDAGITLDTFNITIGLLSRNFDYIRNVAAPAGGTANVTNGDATNGGTRFDFLEIDYTDFDMGETVSFIADIDQDTGNTTRNYENTLFNNGTAPNSVATATFSNNFVLQLTLDDRSTTPTSHLFSAREDITPVPLPAGLPLLLTGLGAFAFARRRK